MSARPFPERLTRHLALYRRKTLGVSEPGTFRYRGRDVAVEHVLPKNQAWLNIPEQTRQQVRAYVTNKGVKLHRYFHHLNSSQAFALSLFVPYFEGSPPAANALLRALGENNDLKEWSAEAVPDEREGTNLDAWWRTADGSQTFCEVKLSEAKFGTATSDSRHLAKFERIYRPRLAEHLDPQWLEPLRFFGAYQIMRNLWHAAGSDSGRVVFLFPRQHIALSKLLDPILDAISAELRRRVSVVAIEDVLQRLQVDSRSPADLREYAGLLAKKYLPDTP